MNLGIVRTFIWSGVVLLVGTVIAQGLLMQFIPPPSPALDAATLKQIFIDRQSEIQLGSLIQVICWSFWLTWGIALTYFIRLMERDVPILTYTSVALNGGGYVVFTLIPMTWAVIAFRPRELDATLMQIMNDWVWFEFLYMWPPFALWMVLIAVAILRDHNAPPVFPRWVAFYNLWSALLISPAGLIVFFKKGPFAYDGLVSFWLAGAVFFGWMVVMTVAMLRSLSGFKDRLPTVLGLGVGRAN